MATYDVQIVSFVTSALGRKNAAEELTNLLNEGYKIIATVNAPNNQPPSDSGESTALVTVILQREE